MAVSRGFVKPCAVIKAESSSTAVKMIISDTIGVTHRLEFGRITPTDKWQPDNKPGITPTFTFSLSEYPKAQYPSGGLSGKISPSEMVICHLEASNYKPLYDVVIFKWYRNEKTHSKLLRSVISNDFNEHGAKQYSSFDYSFIGHFPGEIMEVGCYSCEVLTPWGKALIKFKVI